MADIGDRASKLEAEYLARSMKQREQAGRNVGPSSKYCEECENPIPEGRRLAVPGCTLCVKCQEALENG